MRDPTTPPRRRERVRVRPPATWTLHDEKVWLRKQSVRTLEAYLMALQSRAVDFTGEPMTADLRAELWDAADRALERQQKKAAPVMVGTRHV